MNIRPIKTEADYKAALREIDSLFDAEPDTPKGDRLEVLVTLVEAYEAKHHRIPLPDPIEAIKYHMERLGLSRRDLEPCIGSRARVSEMLSRKRPLTLKMIRNLEATLGIPAAILIQRYDLVGERDQIGTCGEDYYELGERYNQSAGAGEIVEGKAPTEVERPEFENLSVGGVLDERLVKPIHVPNWPRFAHSGEVTANSTATDTPLERITS